MVSNYIIILAIIILVFFILVFVIPLFIFPGFLRKKRYRTTDKTKKIANKLKGKNKEETLRNVFDYIKKMYSEEKYNLFIKLKSHFHRKINGLVDKKQFLPCHMQSFVFASLLMSTGQFKEDDIKKKIIIQPYLVIHEYYLVKIDNKIFKVDPFFNNLQEIK